MTLIQSIIQAYSDCNDVGGDRNLNFMPAAPIDAKALIELMPLCIPDGYNQFDPVESIGQLVQVFGDDAEYFVARESSVCIYVMPTVNLWLGGEGSRSTNFKSINADEILFDPDKKMFRFWWY